MWWEIVIFFFNLYSDSVKFRMDVFFIVFFVVLFILGKFFFDFGFLC